MDEDEADGLAVLRAQIDQMMAMTPEVARAARAWFRAFRREGFDDKQAIYLTAAQIIQTPGPPPG